MNEQDIEAEIQEKGLTAPRLTPDYIDKCIVKEQYHVFEGTQTMVCCLILKNGFTVTGESACASSENFDAEIGQKIARENARNKIWLLEGYLLKEKLTSFVSKTAAIAHEVNKAYCASLGDYSQLSWIDAPQWQKDSAIAGVQFHLATDATPEESHNSWLKQKYADGWSHGKVTDAELKQHPCCVPYSALPQEQRTKDYLFKAVVASCNNC